MSSKTWYDFYIPISGDTMKQRKNVAFASLLLVCALTAGAHADIKYSQRMTTGDSDTTLMHTTHFVANGKERDDTTMKMGNYESTESNVYLCQTKQTFRIDRALKIYTVSEAAAGKPGNTSNVPSKNSSNNDKPGEGKVSLNIKITDLPDEKVAGFDADHFEAVLHTKTSGCIGNSDTTVKMEMWVSKIKNATACKESGVNYNDILGYGGGKEDKCKITYQTTGDVARFNNAWNGIVLRQKIYQDGKLVTVQEVTSLSQAKLDDATFAVPAGFTILSEKDYNDRRQKAMMEAMMGGAAKSNAQSNSGNSNRDAEAEEAPKSDKSKSKSKSKSRRKRFKLPF